MQSKHGLALMGMFMVVFPAAGLLFFWRDAHSRVEKSGLVYMGREVSEVLKSGERQRLLDDGTLTLRNSATADRFESSNKSLGALRSLGGWNVERVWAGSREDMVWQFVRARAEAVYEKGTVTVFVTVARRTMAPEWRIEDIQIGKAP